MESGTGGAAPPYQLHEDAGSGRDALGGRGGAPSASGSAMSVPNAKLETLDGGAKRGGAKGGHSWKKIAAIVVGLVILLALALGLGLGLGLKGQGSGSGSGSGSPPPPPPGPPSNSTSSLPANIAWQIVLSETLTLDNQSGSTKGPLVTPNPTTQSNVSLYDIDMFLHQNLSVVQDLRAEGVEVICYFSSGSYEPGRPDSWKFKSDDMGKELNGWPGEHWLDLNSDNVRQIMISRIEIAAQMNCSGIDPDNVDGYDNENGLDLTKDDSINFMKFLANEASSRGMMTGLKNAGGIINDVIDYVQFSVNEQCVQYGECDTFQPFTDANKPVFHIEYPADADDTADKSSYDTTTVSKYCDIGVSSGEYGFNTVLKYMNLSGWVQYCDDRTYITDGF